MEESRGKLKKDRQALPAYTNSSRVFLAPRAISGRLWCSRGRRVLVAAALERKKYNHHKTEDNDTHTLGIADNHNAPPAERQRSPHALHMLWPRARGDALRHGSGPWRFPDRLRFLPVLDLLHAHLAFD